MEPSQTPSGLEQWVELLQDKPLPVPTRPLTLLRQELNKAGVSLQQLSPIIAADPVLSMHCVSLANRLNRNPDTDVSTIELAVATLGLDRIRQLSEQLPGIKLNSASVPHKQYFHALSNSYHAATQALTLCRYKDPSIINNSRTAALFYGVGHWALWRYAPQTMSRINIRIHEQQQDTALAEFEELGCTIQQISERLVKHWCLSRLAAEALQHETSPSAEKLQYGHQQAEHPNQLDEEHQREVKQLFNAPYYPVKLANWLALTAPQGWQQPKALQIMQLISDLLRQPIDDTTALLHQNCVAASRQHPMPGLLSPAAMMLLLPSEMVFNYRIGSVQPQPPAMTAAGQEQPSSSPPKTAATKPQSDPAATQATETAKHAQAYRDEVLFKDALHQLQDPTTTFDNRNQILQLLLKGIVEGLGLARILGYPIDAQLKQLAAVHRGCSRSDPLILLDLNLCIPSLFKQMTHKPLTLRVDEHNRDKAWPALPDRFKAICHPHSFIVSSLFIDHQLALILYADQRDPDTRVTTFQLQQFKHLASAANHRLNTLRQQPE